jgi:hypothetical protein
MARRLGLVRRAFLVRLDSGGVRDLLHGLGRPVLGFERGWVEVGRRIVRRELRDLFHVGFDRCGFLVGGGGFGFLP